jgi:hypothetical protein
MTERHAPISPRYLTGLIVLGFGVLILLSNLGFADLSDAASWWPVGLVAVGVLKVISARSGPAMLGGTLWAAAGLWILLFNLHIIKLSLWTAIALYWPVVLIVIGLSIIFRRGSPHCSAPAVPSMEPGKDGTLEVMTVLGGTKRMIASNDFKKAEVSAILGGVNLDFSRSSMVPTLNGEAPVATIHIYSMWGGIEMRVPEGWRVETQMATLLSGYEDTTRPSSDPRAPRLILRGSTLMSGIEVKN